MTNRVVKVKWDTVAACMTCPLCNKLLKEATTITECLHTFCRKCIYDKISKEETKCCPTCNTDLGSVPLEKLRPDHNLQDVRAKIFPSKRRKVKALEVAPPVSLPPRRKERSLSELIVNAPKVSTSGARVVAELDDSSPTSLSTWTEVDNLEQADLDLLKENADLREEIASANDDLFELSTEREIIQEELERLHLKLSVAHRELEEEQTQAWENYDYLFEEYRGLQNSMKKQEDDRQRERGASATTIAALQSEVETIQRERELDRMTALEAHNRLNQTNQELQARLEQIQKELEETKAAAPDRRSIVKNWSRSKCFHYAARYHYGFFTAVGYSICRRDVLKVTPDYDITPLRFMNERFLTNGRTLLKQPTEPPQICFEDELEAAPNEVFPWTLQPVYSQEDPYEGEVLPLPKDDDTPQSSP